MPGLSLQEGAGPVTPTVIRNASTNVTVTASLTTGLYTDYWASSLQWYLYSPSAYPVAPTLTPGSGASNQTFTPVFSGRHLVIFSAIPLTAAELDETSRIELTAVYEADPPAFAEGVPAPNETVDYSTDLNAPEGWSRSVEEYMNLVRHLAANREVFLVFNNSGGAFTKHQIVTVDPGGVTGPLQRYNGSGGASYDSSDFATELAFEVQLADATTYGAVVSPNYILLEDIPDQGKGLAMARGIIPMDTTGFTTFDQVYLSDTPGAMVDKATALGGSSTFYVPLGTIGVGNRADPMDTVNGPGQLLFDGTTVRLRMVHTTDGSEPEGIPKERSIPVFGKTNDAFSWIPLAESRKTIIPANLGAPTNLSVDMDLSLPEFDTTRGEPFVLMEANGSNSTGEFYYYFEVPENYKDPIGNGLSFTYRISDNTGSNTIQVGIYQNGSSVLLDSAVNPPTTGDETYTITPSELTAGAVSFAAGDRVALYVLVSLVDTESLTLYTAAFEHDINLAV